MKKNVCSMLVKAKKKVFWPNIKKDLKQKYETCEEGLLHRRSKAQTHNEVSYENLFQHFESDS